MPDTIPLSVLDHSPIRVGGTAADALMKQLRRDADYKAWASAFLD